MDGRIEELGVDEVFGVEGSGEGKGVYRRPVMGVEIPEA